MKSFVIIITILLIIVNFLTGCSGNGSSTEVAVNSVSGVVAAGAPLNGTVTLLDKNGIQRDVNTDGNGNFTIDTNGLTPPFILKAEGLAGGQPQKLFSVANQVGTTHINPFTNLILAAALGSDPSQSFGSTGLTDIASLSDATLQQALQKVRTLFLPLLNLYGITDFNPLTGSYIVDPANRMDAMLDVLRLTVNSDGSFIVTNRLTGAVMANGNSADLAGVTLDSSKAPDAGTLDDLADLTRRLTALCALLNMGSAMPQQMVEDFFVAESDYGTSNNQTRTQNVASIFTVWGNGGLNTNGKLESIKNLRMLKDLTVDYSGRGVSRAYLINYDFIHENGISIQSSNVTFAKDASSGIWKFIGDPSSYSIGDNYAAFILSSDNFGLIYTDFTIPGPIPLDFIEPNT